MSKKKYTIEIKTSFDVSNVDDLIIQENTTLYRAIPFTQKELLSFVEDSFEEEYIVLRFPRGYHIPIAIIPKHHLLSFRVLDESFGLDFPNDTSLITEASYCAKKGYDEYRD